MFAQHMLRATDWNYTIVAKLGGWTEEALRRSYGEPPQAVMAKWGLKYINAPFIMAERSIFGDMKRANHDKEGK